MKSSLLKLEIEGPNGFSTKVRLTQDELGFVRQIVENSWLERLSSLSPSFAEKLKKTDPRSIDISKHHQLVSADEHRLLGPSTQRILSESDFHRITELPFFRTLVQEFGKFDIPHHHGKSWPSMIWRVVRPGHPEDVGPLHADGWFWQLNLGDEYSHPPLPSDTQRIKIWIPLYVEEGKNGLEVVPGSHLRPYRYKSVEKDGIIKPVIDETVPSSERVLISKHPGECVVFHDDLLHGGVANDGENCRVSLEFTILAKTA